MGIQKNLFKFSLLLSLIFMVMLGCAGTLSPTAPPATEEKHSYGPARSGETGNSPTYYDFDDVLIPPELKLDTQKSMVVSTSTFSGGVLVFNGYVDQASLIDFFLKNMAKDNWQLKGSIKYRHTVLTFEKPNKGCVITIGEKAFNTPVEIWVGILHEPSTGQLPLRQPRL
ncbi:MAG TPA: hypothetical protein ENN18_03405 [Proteobacteria bacterium]|nr:hypothetical protein [Pseudomonadota bacterium]